MATLALAYDPEDPKQPVMFSRRAHSDGSTRDTNNKDKARNLSRGGTLENKPQPEKLGRAEGKRSLVLLDNNPRPPELPMRAAAAKDTTPLNHSGGNAGNCCKDVCDECNSPLFCQPVRCNCEGNCGGQQAPDGCWCDTLKNSDCCCAVCDDHSIYVHTSEGIGHAPGGCWCDSYREIAKDCCSCEFCNVDS